MNSKNYIYSDYNSTTPVDQKVFEAMLPFFQSSFANPNSTHEFGLKIHEKVKAAKQLIADFINASSKELIFTSGATEAINLAIKGLAERNANQGKHIITVATEHKAVLDTCNYLQTKGFEITYLPVQSNGLIDIDQLKESFRPDTILVSVMYVNNETGVIQPIKEIAAITHSHDAIFMTDATQAVGKIAIDVNDLGIDIMCFSGHKMYAPKGIGVLYVRNTVQLTPIIHGGGQEQGMRSGTLNVPGIIALAKACEIAQEEMANDSIRIEKLRNELESELLKISNTTVNGSTTNRIFNTSNICFKGQDAEIMIGRMKNFAVSNGSACTSAVVEPSHVLKAMGLNDEDAYASLRFSLGKYNSEEDIGQVVESIRNLIQTKMDYA